MPCSSTTRPKRRVSGRPTSTLALPERDGTTSTTVRSRRRGEAASIFVAIEGGFRLIQVTLLAEDQNHVVVAGELNDKNEVAVSGISALRGILVGLGAGN